MDESSWLADKALPPIRRAPSDVIWQRSPYKIAADFGSSEGKVQWPGLDFSAPYWVGRKSKLITEGNGTALFWKTTGSCN